VLRAGPCASRWTRLVPCTPPMPQAVRTSCCAPPRLRQRTFIGRQQQVNEHMLQPYVSCISNALKCILHMFHLDAIKVGLLLHMLQYLYTLQVYILNISAVSNVYCKCSSRCRICCSGYARTLQECFPNVSIVSSGCCICCSGYTHVCCKYMF
jgi:hypothetical protein